MKSFITKNCDGPIVTLEGCHHDPDELGRAMERRAQDLVAQGFRALNGCVWQEGGAHCQQLTLAQEARDDA